MAFVLKQVFSFVAWAVSVHDKPSTIYAKVQHWKREGFTSMHLIINETNIQRGIWNFWICVIWTGSDAIDFLKLFVLPEKKKLWSFFITTSVNL